MLTPEQVLTLRGIKGIGPKAIMGLFFKSPKSLLDLESVLRSNKSRVQPSHSELTEANDKAKRIIDTCHALEITLISFGTKEYPKQLSRIANPPILLYSRGNSKALLRTNVAIIGTRTPTEWGAKCAQRLGQHFSVDNFCTVSGLALGCDASAHAGAVETTGSTIAVLAHGLDSIHPKSNATLANQILEGGEGCLVSEYPPNTKPFKSSFVDRDRIQSGLSYAVVVVETGIKGGSMHTVKFCQDQKRILACVNHQYSQQPTAPEGNSFLLKSGAYSVSCTDSLDALKNRVRELKAVMGASSVTIAETQMLPYEG